MAQTGSAQSALSGELTFPIVVGGDRTKSNTFDLEVDSNHCGIQIKLDILEKVEKDQPEHKDMRLFPEDCELILCTGDKKVPVANFDRLSEYSNYFQNSYARLELLSPGSNVESTELKFTDLGLHKVQDSSHVN